MEASPETTHREAAATFARRLRARLGDAVVRVVLFGSVARGEQRGVDSDVDLLVVLADDTHGNRRTVHEVAGDTMLEYGVAVSPHVVPGSALDRPVQRPLVEAALGEGVDV